MSRIDELKQEIVEVVKKEYRFQMVNMFEGNVSIRYNDKMLITPSQVNKEIMTPEMIIETDLEGNILYQREGLYPSSEMGMHLEVYRVRPDVSAVVHNQSMYARRTSVFRFVPWFCSFINYLLGILFQNKKTPYETKFLTAVL